MAKTEWTIINGKVYSLSYDADGDPVIEHLGTIVDLDAFVNNFKKEEE